MTVQQDGQPLTLEQQAANMKAASEYIRGQVKLAFGQARQTGQPQAYRQALEQARTFQDSMEEYVAAAITMKAALARAAADAKDEYDKAWAGQASHNSQTAVRRGEEMEGPRERYARFDVKPEVFPRLREWRQAEQRLSLFSEVLDDMWLRYRAINATREDITAIMRGYAFENSLERT